MSMIKRYMDDLEALRCSAREILCTAGVLKQCEWHSLYFNTGREVEAAYRLANSRISVGKLDIGDATRRDLTDAIKHEFENNISVDGCPQCGRY